ncbi:MAG TPA: Uma2 family endonuclease [Chloroflexota bacterium]|jgi:Uma2 family endonuclease
MAVEPRLLTAEELLAMPDDGMRHELIKGELRTMSPPGGEHGDLAMTIGTHVHNFVRPRRSGRVFAAETGFLFRRHPDTVRAPDVAFIRAERIPPGGVPKGYIPVAPDLVVEVVSPGDTAAEVQEKVEEWLGFGVRAVWVVYPTGPRLQLHLPDGTSRMHGPEDEVDGGEALPGFRMRLRDLLDPYGPESSELCRPP